MKSLFRRTLRHCGIDVPFTDVVCPEYVKSIRVHENACVEVIDRRSLVFLHPPDPGDLRDAVPRTAEDGAPYLSPDAFELHRISTRNGTQVCWMPNEPIVPYALYTHQHGWMLSRDATEVVFTEFRCDMRTGTVDLEMLTSRRFEAAVAFKRPRWHGLKTESSLVKYALRQLDSQGERPTIADDGARLHWKLVGPKAGECYLYVAFQEHGVEAWRKRLEPKTFAARMLRLITRPLASA